MEKLLKVLMLMVVMMASTGLNAKESKDPGQKEYQDAVAALNEKKIEKACKKFEAAIKKGHAEATKAYVDLLTNGEYMPADTLKTIAMLDQAALKGNKMAAFYYANLSLAKKLTDNYDKARSYLIGYSRNGDSEASALIGYICYMRGARDSAIYYYTQAYNQGKKDAARPLAQLNFASVGGNDHTKNRQKCEEAVKWAEIFLQDSPQDEDMKDLLGEIYIRKCRDHNHYTDFNDVKSGLKLIFRNGNKQGLLKLFSLNPDYALTALDCINFNTITDVNLQNDPEFVELFNKIKNEDSRLIAVMYRVGIGTEKDLSKALEAYLKKYQDQSSITCYRIGQLYEQGAEGGVPNINRAKAWYYSGGGLGGYKPALERYKQLNSQQIAQQPKNVNTNMFAPKCYWKDGNLVNEQGKVIMRSGQYQIQNFSSSVIIVKKGNKVGAVNYNGVLVVPVSYDKFEGTGAEGRMLFSNNITNGVSLTIFTTSGKVVAKQNFSNTTPYAQATFIKNNMNFLTTP